MKKDSYYTFLLLEQIEQDGAQSQRNISQQLGFALGLTNAYIKRLVNKGYVMVTTMPRNRIWYNLTPKGISEKARLTLLYMRDSVNFYSDLKQKVFDALAVLEAQGVQSIALVGEGEILEIVLLCVLDTKMKLAAIYSTDNQPRRIARRAVNPLDKLPESRCDAILLADLSRNESLYQRMEDMGIPKEKIRHLADCWVQARSGGK